MVRHIASTVSKIALVATIGATAMPSATAQTLTPPTEPPASIVQDVQPAGANAPGATAGDIIVTGTRRASRIQDVPIAITAVSSEKLKDSGFATPSDLQYVVPTVTFNPQVGAGFLIRGVGSQGFDYNLEKAVAVVVDDVVQGLPRSIGFNTFADVERIEVLEGPQGNLFGKNASSGVIYAVTRKPVLGRTEFIGSASYGSFNELRLDGTVNVPISETLAARLTGVHQRRDGFIDNRALDIKAGGYRDDSVRAKLLWKPTADLEAYLLAEYQDHQDDGPNIAETVRSYVAPTGGVPVNSRTLLDYTALLAPYGIVFGPNNRTIANDYPTGVFIKQAGVQGTITYNVGGYSLTSVTAYKHQKSGNQSDADYTATTFFSLNVGRLSGHQLSQEIRLNSPLGGFFDFVVGGFYYDQNVAATERQGQTYTTATSATQFISPVGALANYTARSNSLAVFGTSNFHVTPQLTLTLGGRFTHDVVGGSYFPTSDPMLLPRTTFPSPLPGPAVIPAVAGRSSANDFSGKATIEYKPLDNVMLYATYATGYKAPAIGTSRGTLRYVDPETVSNYEVGLKTQFFDRLLTVNLVGFWQEFKNFQVQTVLFNTDNSLLNVLANAPGLQSRGITADVNIRPASGLTFFGSASYNPTKYKGFLTSCYRGQTVNAVAGPGCYAVFSSSGARNTVYDVSGLPSVNAPKATFNIGFNFEKPVSSNYRMFASGTFTHRSGAYSIAGDPSTILQSYGIINGSVGVSTADERTRISLFVRNLADKNFQVRIRALSFAGVGSYAQTPSSEGMRTVGIRLDKTF